jgi:hypothetical protein
MRVAVVRRYPGCPAGVRTLCLSLVMLGLIDSVALAPLAFAAALFPGAGIGVRVGLAVVAVAGVAAAAVIVALPRLAASRRALRFRLGRWLSPRTSSLRGASQAWAHGPASDADSGAATHVGSGWWAMIAQAATQLDWQAFCARSFPDRGRHDFEVLKAYEAYRNSSPVEERFPRDAGAPSGEALQVSEGEGGAVRASGQREGPPKRAFSVALGT